MIVTITDLHADDVGATQRAAELLVGGFRDLWPDTWPDLPDVLPARRLPRG